MATVLLVDDKAAVRNLGAEALVCLLHSTVRIDLLISDIDLPGHLNGRQLADLGHERCPHLEILSMTGHAKSNVLEHRPLLDAGMAIRLIRA